MPRPNDTRGKPGDIVLVRGGKPITVWRGFGDTTNRAGTVMPRSMGIIISVDMPGWTYVLWSIPCVLGWSHDGELRRM